MAPYVLLYETVTYAYDAFNQLIRRTVSGPEASDRFFILDRVPLAAGASPSSSTFTQLAYSSAQSDTVLYDAVSSPDALGQIVLQFDTVGTSLALTHRYLWGPGVDFQLADEQLPAANRIADTHVVWPLVDHLATVRDLVEYVEVAPGVLDTVVQKHRAYDSYGNILWEFNRGDFDGDGEYTVADADALLEAIFRETFGIYTDPLYFDIDGDGVVTQTDIETFVLRVVYSVFGDANMDGVADGSDFGTWNANKFTNSNYHLSVGDFNFDGVVDGSDFAIWNVNRFQTASANFNTQVLDHLFAFTGRMLDQATGLQNNLNRWYDANVGRWVSEDPIGFAARDANVLRYVGNSPTNAADPTGLVDAFNNQFYCEEYRWKNPGYGKRRHPDGSLDCRTSHPSGVTLDTNGCTKVPDNFVGYSFTDACNQHDKCYAECGASRLECDRDFLSNMLAECQNTSGYDGFVCWLTAVDYYNGVRLFGVDAYQSSQDEVCIWKKCCE